MDIEVKNAGVRSTVKLDEFIVDTLSSGDEEVDIENLKWTLGRLIEILAIRNTLDAEEIIDILDIQPEYVALKP